MRLLLGQGRWLLLGPAMSFGLGLLAWLARRRARPRIVRDPPSARGVLRVSLAVACLLPLMLFSVRQPVPAGWPDGLWGMVVGVPAIVGLLLGTWWVSRDDVTFWAARDAAAAAEWDRLHGGGG